VSGIRTWIPFVASYEKLLLLDEALKDVAERKTISGELQTAAAALRRPYFRTTAKMASRNDSLGWWANTIPERNTMVNRLFLYCCYAYLADRYLSAGGDLCFVCENNALIDTIGLMAEKRGYQVTLSRPFLIFREAVLCSALAGVYHLVLNSGAWLVVRTNGLMYRHKGEGGGSNPDIVIHTWVDEKCFGSDGSFKDRYFKVLPDYCRRKGLAVGTFVTIYDIQRSLWQALTFFRKSEDHFIIPEDYYTLSDYLFPFLLWFKRMRFRFDEVEIQGIDCSILFKRNNALEGVNFATMYYCLFGRLVKKGLRPKVVIDGFENMVSDKMIQLGVRRFMSGATIIGFYHMAPPPNLLCCYTDAEELPYAPLPDRIVCNGERYREILAGEHFPKEKIVVGAALRYSYLHQAGSARSPESSGEFRILLTLSLEEEASLEIFHKLREAVKGIERYRMLIKPHPMGTSIVKRMAGDFSPGTRVVEGTMAQAMDQCHIVVCGASGAAIDCVMSDKEVIRVGRETQIDLDPLRWFGEFEKPVLSIEELGRRIKELEGRIMNPDYQPPHYSVMLPSLFSDVTEESLKVFLPTDNTASGFHIAEVNA